MNLACTANASDAATMRDAEWLDSLYPKYKAALAFQSRLDQDGDGVPDLWGSGCCTYDTELYPYYGASSYATSLYLAALRVGELLATERGDATFANWARDRFAAAQQVMENELWDEALGYYISWRDRAHEGWKGARAHGALRLRAARRRRSTRRA